MARPPPRVHGADGIRKGERPTNARAHDNPHPDRTRRLPIDESSRAKKGDGQGDLVRVARRMTRKERKEMRRASATKPSR